jgi:membrane-associated phospholipid phosphatase
VDRPVARYAVTSGLSPALKSNWQWLARTIRIFGSILTYTIPAAVLLAICGRKWLLQAAFVLVGGALSGIGQILKWIVGRPRPFHEDVFTIHPFSGGWNGLIHEKNLSFPSGDVCLAAVTSVCLMILFPRWRWLWIAIICMVALERVSEGAHYPSDVVAGAALGTALAHLARRLYRIKISGSTGRENSE